jgi:hypothetical protein
MIYPTGVMLGSNGNLFFADSGNNRIRMVDTHGIIITVAGNGPNYPNNSGFSGDGGAATNASLNGPNGVAMDAGGNLFISDSGNHRIRRVSSSSTQPSYSVITYSTNNAGIYSVVVTNAAGVAVSSNAALTVVLSPNSRTNLAGSTATFSVQTFGPEALNFHWQKNGANLVDGGNVAGSATSQLTLANVTATDAASYRVIVSDATTGVTTANATLTVTATAATLGGYLFSGISGFQFQIAGVPGANYAVQASTNLVDWLSLITNTAPFTFTDTNGVWPQCYYRALYLP